ncbi:Aspartate aminotransferase [Diaporthe amygdali]|uniref:Aspartate aminotransferase n=1 Tax=Phomopsis amygdali TaxID=1214568 RepID=UPI0022FDDC27|nr:Aspartate aminotransferase [Diaporthe amygdali]KAJ0109348.1 Aspartate aminotransferase [Diaporthe amygdali]
MGSLATDASLFDAVEYIPPDAIFDLTRLYLADPDARKVNLGQGTYKDEQGKPWILPSVRVAKETIRDANHEYLPILGLASFRALTTQLVFGEKSTVIKEERVAACQALSGTGALSLAGSFLHQTLPAGTPVYITEPTWSNHRQVFEAVGFEVREFRWYSAETGQLDLPSVLDALSQAPSQSVFIFHASAHNPSGCDPSKGAWRQIADIVKERQLLPLFDSAYLGITSGNYADDAFAIRYFAEELGLETVVCASFAKNMGLYGERVGHVSITTKSASSAKAVESRLAQLTRSHISNPPAFGARIAAAILGDSELRTQWKRDLVTMSSRIAGMRKALYEELVKLGTPGDWKRILEQKGMFCILGMSLEEVLKLRGLNKDNVAYVAAGIDNVVRNR